MTDYTAVESRLRRVTDANSPQRFASRIGPLLAGIWAHEYSERTKDCVLLETSVNGFSYLFDARAGRLVAAWGVSRGRSHESRDAIATRMKGHPLSNSGLYHRGHAIAHTLGGGTDINLVPQLGKINTGRFRALEKKAVANSGSLYFSYWLYARAGDSQVPQTVQQGLLCPHASGCSFELAVFEN